MNDLTLSALLCSRLCHDLISPIGAVNNGIEVLLEEDSEDMRAQAIDLVSYSAGEAVRRLQFYRLAFGAAEGSGTGLGLEDARKAAEGLLSNGRIALDWPDNHVNVDARLGKTSLKILLNLILIGIEALARGGTISVRIKDDGDATQVSVISAGERAALGEHLLTALAGDIPEGGLDARSAQPHYSARLAASLSTQIDCATAAEGRVETMIRLPKATT